MDERIKKIDLTGALPDEGSTNTRIGNTIGDLGTGAPGSSLNSDSAGTIGGGGTVINPAAGLDGPNAQTLERAGGGMAGQVIGKADQYVSDGCDEYCEGPLEGNRTIRVDRPIPPEKAA